MSDVNRNDAELWQLICEGQESAFTQLIARHLPSLLHYGNKFSSDYALVQDCVQDVLADLWLRRTRESPILSVRAYLFTAVRHHICREARKTLRAAILDDDNESASFEATFSVEDAWIADETERERLEKLNSLVNQLPPRQKEIVYLRYYQGLEKDQIAQILDINYQSVSNLLHRTLTTLRNQFPVFFYVFLALKGYFFQAFVKNILFW